MHAAIAFVTAHWAGVTLAFGLVASPAVATMPASIPRTRDDWWKWFFDYSHQLSNSRNDRLATQPIPAPPNPEAVSPKA